jgi:AraC-like DNA-binding protein
MNNILSMSPYLIFQIILVSILGLNALLLSVKGYLISRYLKYLGSVLLLMSIYFFAVSFFYDFYLLKSYPHFLLTLSPINFVIVPLFYFSVRSIATGDKFFGNKDLFHLIPAILRFVDLVPFYLLPKEDKLFLINKYFPSVYDLSSNASGFIPGIWVRIVCLILMIYYFTLSIKFIFNLPIEILNKFKREKFNNILFGTLVAATLLCGSYVIIFFINVQFYFTEIKFTYASYFFYFFLFSIILVYDIYLFLKLEFGSTIDSNKKLKDIQISPQYSTLNSFTNTPLDWEDTGLTKLDVEDNLNHLLEEKKIFLIRNLTVSDFAIEADLPQRLLPHILYLTYKKTFKELINERRVKFAKEKIENGFLIEFTIETLSTECGFNSRITFFNSFKKELDISPNQYWAKIQGESKIVI